MIKRNLRALRQVIIRSIASFEAQMAMAFAKKVQRVNIDTVINCVALQGVVPCADCNGRVRVAHNWFVEKSFFVKTLVH